MFVNKPSTVLVNTGIAANNTISGENIAVESFVILKILQRASVGCRLVVVWLCERALYYCFILIVTADVYCRMFITTRVAQHLKSPSAGIVLRILYTLR